MCYINMSDLLSKSSNSYDAAVSLKDKFYDSAVSRYYFSAFQSVKYFADIKGFNYNTLREDFRKKSLRVPGSHEAVILFLKNIPGFRDCIEKLSSLKKLRTNSDYLESDIEDLEIQKAEEYAMECRLFIIDKLKELENGK